MKVELGKRYKDKQTGFRGVAAVRCEYATSTPTVGLKFWNGNTMLTEWFDEESLMLENMETPPPPDPVCGTPGIA